MYFGLLIVPPINIHQVLVPIKALNTQTRLIIKFAILFATTNQAAITLYSIKYFRYIKLIREQI